MFAMYNRSNSFISCLRHALFLRRRAKNIERAKQEAKEYLSAHNLNMALFDMMDFDTLAQVFECKKQDYRRLPVKALWEDTVGEYIAYYDLPDATQDTRMNTYELIVNVTGQVRVSVPAVSAQEAVNYLRTHDCCLIDLPGLQDRTFDINQVRPVAAKTA